RNNFEMLLQIAPELEKSAPGELESQRGCMTFEDLVNSVTAEDYATMSYVSSKVQFDQDAFIQFSSHIPVLRGKVLLQIET
ncbi:hypothetical protein HPB47_003827, partial [Ixodes persulcatus]